MLISLRGSIALLPLILLACAPGAGSSQQTGAGSWETLPQGDRPTRRYENGYVAVGDRFYLFGGRGIKPVDIFDPASGTWTAGAATPLEIHHFQGVEYDGKVYVVGALMNRFPNEPPLPDVYVYDPAADAWSKGPALPADRVRGAAAAVAHDGLIYVVGGQQVGHASGHVAWFDSLDPRTGEWRRLPDAPHARDHFQVGVIDGKLYAAGGRRSAAASGQPFELTVAEVDVYDFATGRWTTLPASSNIPTPRAGTTAAVLNGKLLVIGGESAGQTTGHAEVESFDPATGRWTTLAPMNQGRHAMQAIVHGGKLYIAAGSHNRGHGEYNSHEVYTPGR